jgi:hypothetical protein
LVCDGVPVYGFFSFRLADKRVTDNPGYKRLRREARATLLRQKRWLQMRDIAEREGDGATLLRISKGREWREMRTEMLRFDGAVERHPAIDAWMKEHAGGLGEIAQQWFEVMRKCGDEVRELLHDGCPVACLGDAPFGYVNVFTSHVNVGFFHGAALPDPARLLQGTGKFMRHVKLRPGTATNAAALSRLIEAAYADIKARVEHG